MMLILFVGVGSIAKRHIKNIYEIFEGNIEIDVRRRVNHKTDDEYVNSCINRIIVSDNDLCDHYDAIFITNPTSRHYDTLLKYQGFSDAFFIEKPVFLTGKEDLLPLGEDHKKFYVACPMRYMKIMQYIKENLQVEDIYSIRCISSSYLPEWRQGIDYRSVYSAHKELGGGVSTDLIHEWDYIQYLFGYPKKIKSLIKKKSKLELDSDDIAIYIGEYDRCTVEVHLDYFGRKPIRKMELFCSEDTIEVDFLKQKISYLYSGKVITFNESRDDFHKRELINFFDIVSGKADNINNIQDASKTLRLTRGCL